MDPRKRKLAKLRSDAIAAFGRSVSTVTEIVLRAEPGGAKLTQDQIDELLAKAVARERVSIVLDVLAYEQGRRNASGEVVNNRNYIRFRDGAMMALGRSGRRTPFLRDHRQYDSTARGGTVLESRTEKLTDDGHYQIWQTVELTEPSAVERALRGLMSAVSIGARATGPVLCTACNTEVFSKCWHFPGDILERDGKEFVVLWEYTAAELIETSEVPIGAVQTASIQGVRAELHALLSGAPIPGAADFHGEDLPEETQDDMDPKLLELLGLAATASASEVLAAVEALKLKLSSAAADQAELAVTRQQLQAFQADIAALQADKRKRDEDAFINAAIDAGQITLAEVPNWRALFEAAPERAKALMAERKPGFATPVGQPRQSELSAGAGGPEVVITSGFRPSMSLSIEQRRDQAIAMLKTNPKAAAWAAAFGLDPKGRFDLPMFGPTTISNNNDLEPARVGFQAAFLEAVAGEPDPVMAVATTVPSTKKEENYAWVGDLPGMQEWKTDRMLKVLEAYSFAIKNKKWEASLRVKNDDIADDALGLLAPLLSDMAATARLHPGILVARLLLNGFAGTAFPELGDGLAFDGDFFFSATHATGSNKLSVAFSATSLATAATMLRQQKRFDGGNLYARGTHLIVGVADEALAEKILTQEILANGESNTQKNKYKLIVTPEFTAGEWVLADLSGGVKPILFQNREPLTTQVVGGSSNADTVGFMYDEAWFGAKARYNAGYFDFRRCVGSKP